MNQWRWTGLAIVVLGVLLLGLWMNCGDPSDPASVEDMEDEPSATEAKRAPLSSSQQRHSVNEPEAQAPETPEMEAPEEEDSEQPGGQDLSAGPETTKAPVLGAMSRGSIDDAIQEAMPEIEQCYQQALAEVPDLSGRISVKFVIRGEDGVGRVSKVDIKEAEFDDVPMEDCILDEVEALEFDPPVGGGIVIVSYPFVFEQD